MCCEVCMYALCQHMVNLCEGWAGSRVRSCVGVLCALSRMQGCDMHFVIQDDGLITQCRMKGLIQ